MKTPQQQKQKFLQHNILNQLRNKQLPVKVHLINGIVLQGIIKDFDTEVIQLKNDRIDKGLQMIYKSAISTIQKKRWI